MLWFRYCTYPLRCFWDVLVLILFHYFGAVEVQHLGFGFHWCCVFNVHTHLEWVLCYVKRSFQESANCTHWKVEGNIFLLTTAGFKVWSIEYLWACSLMDTFLVHFMVFLTIFFWDACGGFQSCSWLNLIRDVYLFCLIKIPSPRVLTSWLLAVNDYKSEAKSTQTLPET